MARHYLEFEKPIQDFEDKIMKLQSLENDEVNPLELKKLIDRRFFFMTEILIPGTEGRVEAQYKHGNVENTKLAYQIYTTKEEESSGVQITLSMILVLFSLCFILIAVLIGFNFARRLSKPISNLIDSANDRFWRYI